MCCCTRVVTLLFAAALIAGMAPGMVVMTVQACRFQPVESVQCETLRYPICNPLQNSSTGSSSSSSSFQINTTSFPNVFGHRNQSEASRFLREHPFLSPENLDCSPYAKIFLCSSLFPLCYQRLFQKVEPCREMCEAVRDDCLPTLRENGVAWPRSLNCSRNFAPFGSRLCIWNETSDCAVSLTMATSSPAASPVPPPPSLGSTTDPSSSSSSSSSNDPPITPPGSGGVGNGTSSGGSTAGSRGCAGHLVPTNSSRASFGGVERCAEPCVGVYFEEEHSTLLAVWTVAISFLTLLVAILVTFTFLLNFRTVLSLEASVYYLTLCYGGLSLVNLLVAALGREDVVCDRTFRNAYNESALVSEGLGKPACAALFSFTYYFTLCTWSWWGVLTVEWGVLVARRGAPFGGGGEGGGGGGWEWKIVSHVCAWGLPCVFLLATIFVDAVSGDPVSRVCWIDKGRELGFVLAPLAVAIGICCIVSLIGFARVVSLQNRKFRRTRDGVSTSRPTTTTTTTTSASSPSSPPSSPASSATEGHLSPSQLNKLGTYLVFCLVPMGLLFCAHFYDYWYRGAWEATYVRSCASVGARSLHSCAGVPSRAKPSVVVYMARVLVSMCMGVLSVLWLLRPRLLLAWRDLCCVLCAFSLQQYKKPPQHTDTQEAAPQPRQPQPTTTTTTTARLQPILLQMQEPSSSTEV